MAKLRHASAGDHGGDDRAASGGRDAGGLRGHARTMRPRTQPVGAEEGAGLLLRNGVFLVSVRYTLVAFEQDRQPAADSDAARVVYTAVLQFEADAADMSRLLESSGQVFALETAGGQKLACRPVERLSSNYLRWIVRLTPET